MPKSLSYVLLGLIVAGFILFSTLYAIYTPDWQAPDEPAHYNYIAQIATDGCCPVIQMGDWDSAYLEDLKVDQFPENADIAPIEYEDHQPPLYYLAGALVYNAFNGSLIALRLMSVTFGAVTVFIAYFVIMRLFPAHPPLALATAAFIAFLPQNLAIMASVNNDSLANLLAALLLLITLAYLGNPLKSETANQKSPHAALLGAILGIALTTKLTIYFTAGIVALAVLLRWRRDKHTLRWFVTQSLWTGLTAFIISAVWWFRNIRVYGWPDFLGQIAHGRVVVGQLRTADYLAEAGFAQYLRAFLTTTYHSFWGQFGWMGVPMPSRVYLLTGIFSILVIVGLVLFLNSPNKPDLNTNQRSGIWIIIAAAALVLLEFLYYNLTFVQFQGRYLFPALIPVGLAIALGLYGWTLLLNRWLNSERSQQLINWLPLLALAWLPLLALIALFRYIVPNLG